MQACRKTLDDAAGFERKALPSHFVRAAAANEIDQRILWCFQILSAGGMVQLVTRGERRLAGGEASPKDRAIASLEAPDR